MAATQLSAYNMARMKYPLLIGAALLIAGPALAQTPKTWSSFVTDAPAATAPVLSTDRIALVRGGATYNLPGGFLTARRAATGLYQVTGTSTTLDGAGTWEAVKPDGSAVAIANPCSTGNCLGAALADASDHGRNFYLEGGGTIGSAYPATATNGNLFQTSTLTMGPWQGKSLGFDFYTLNLNTGATPGIVFDSCMLCDIDHQGQIVYSGTSDAVRWAPTNYVPIDHLKTWTSTRAYIRGIANNGGTPTAMAAFDLTNGSYNSAFLHLGEVNGAGAPGTSPGAIDGILIHNLTNSFFGNYTVVDQIHQVLEAALRSGSGATTNVGGNLWDVAGTFPVGATAGTSYGLVEWGQGNSHRFGVIGNNEGTGALASGTGPDTALGTCLDYETGSQGNVDILARCTGYNTAGVNFKTGSVNHLAIVGYYAPYSTEKPFWDDGTNNAVLQGATFFTKSGLTVTAVDSTGVQTAGKVTVGDVASPAGSDLILSPPTGKVLNFGSPGGGATMTFNGIDLFPAADAGVTLGDASHRFNGLWLTSLTVTPGSKQPLCIDTSTGQVFKGSGGSC